MNAIKKSIFVTLAVLLLLAVFPLTAQAATGTQTLYFTATDGRFHQGSQTGAIYTGQAGAWSWNSNTNTLTLNGFIWDSSAAIALYVVDNITISLQGTNRFASTYNGNSTSYGIYCNNNLTITGSGTLAATGGTVTNTISYEYALSYGIYGYGITINSGTVNATGGNCVKRGNPYGSANSVGIVNLTMNNGLVTARGGNCITSQFANDAVSCGINGLTMNGGTVYAVGGSASSTDDTTVSAGIDGWNGLRINGGIVIATGGSASGSNQGNSRSYGLYRARATVSGGTLTAIGNLYALGYSSGTTHSTVAFADYTKYTYWVNTTTGDPGGIGISGTKYPGDLPLNDYSNPLNNYKYLRVIAVPGITVTFVDWNGLVLKTQIVEYGAAATAPTDPNNKEGWQFAYWDVAFDNITTNLTVTAVYEINVYTVKFLDHDGVELKTESVEHGSAASAPTEPDNKEGWHFLEWDIPFDSIISDLTVKALYEINTYTVEFLDWNGEILDKQEVEHDSPATAPTDPDNKEHWHFVGWDTYFSKITADLTVTALYEFNSVEYYLGMYDFVFYPTIELKDYTAGEIIYMDVMLVGHMNYALTEVRFAYDTDLLKYLSSQDPGSWAFQAKQEEPNLVYINNIASINLNTGGSTTEPVKLVTLKFLVLEDIAKEDLQTALNVYSLLVYIPPGVPAPASSVSPPVVYN